MRLERVNDMLLVLQHNGMTPIKKSTALTGKLTNYLEETN